MRVCRSEIVGLVNDVGTVQSVIKYEDVFEYFIKEIEKMVSDHGDKVVQPRKSILPDSDDDDEVCMLVASAACVTAFVYVPVHVHTGVCVSTG